MTCKLNSSGCKSARSPLHLLCLTCMSHLHFHHAKKGKKKKKVGLPSLHPKYYHFFIPMAKTWSRVFFFFEVRSYASLSSLGNEVFWHAWSEISTSKLRADRVDLRAPPPPILHLPPSPSELSSFFLPHFTLNFLLSLFLWSLYQFSHFWAERGLLFWLWEINSHYRKERKRREKEHAREGGRQAAIPVSLTLPDGCHLP